MSTVQVLMTTTYVQKFGGSSLARREDVIRCAERVAGRRAGGNRVVVVVSAMGATTDDLISLGKSVHAAGRARERDMLMAAGEQISASVMALALQALGFESVALTGTQAGFTTDDDFGCARILSIRTARLLEELEAGRIPVVMGFQGATTEGELTTFGRGGSDTTAVALAAALDIASSGGICEIFTDVDGVHTADPRLVPGPPLLEEISYEEMLEMALHGARVMEPRALVFGDKYGVPIRVRHSRRSGEGTLITSMESTMERPSVVGCALKEDLGRISVTVPTGDARAQARLFEATAEAGIIVDDIIQTEYGDTAVVAFTVEHGDLTAVRTAVVTALEGMGFSDQEPQIEIGLAKVSAIGTGMKTHTGIASRMFRALADNGIPIRNITTSEIKISCLVTQEHGQTALESIHAAFDLGRPADERSESLHQ